MTLVRYDLGKHIKDKIRAKRSHVCYIKWCNLMRMQVGEQRFRILMATGQGRSSGLKRVGIMRTQLRCGRSHLKQIKPHACG